MRMYLSYMLTLLVISSWLTDFDQARTFSKNEHRCILLNFSGSDWCAGCIKMRNDIFNSPVFQQYASERLVLVNADFPRLHKNQLPHELEEKNDALAARYNPEGHFPFTLLLDSNGTVLKSWDGYYKKGPESFVSEIKVYDGSDH